MTPWTRSPERIGATIAERTAGSPSMRACSSARPLRATRAMASPSSRRGRSRSTSATFAGSACDAAIRSSSPSSPARSIVHQSPSAGTASRATCASVRSQCSDDDSRRPVSARKRWRRSVSFAAVTSWMMFTASGWPASSWTTVAFVSSQYAVAGLEVDAARERRLGVLAEHGAATGKLVDGDRRPVLAGHLEARRDRAGRRGEQLADRARAEQAHRRVVGVDRLAALVVDRHRLRERAEHDVEPLARRAGDAAGARGLRARLQGAAARSGAQHGQERCEADDTDADEVIGAEVVVVPHAARERQGDRQRTAGRDDARRGEQRERERRDEVRAREDRRRRRLRASTTASVASSASTRASP